MTWLATAAAYAGAIAADVSGRANAAFLLGVIATVLLLCALERHAERGDGV
jgi:hypothetical protein